LLIYRTDGYAFINNSEIVSILLYWRLQ